MQGNETVPGSSILCDVWFRHRDDNPLWRRRV